MSKRGITLHRFPFASFILVTSAIPSAVTGILRERFSPLSAPSEPQDFTVVMSNDATFTLRFRAKMLLMPSVIIEGEAVESARGANVYVTVGRRSLWPMFRAALWGGAIFGLLTAHRWNEFLLAPWFVLVFAILATLDLWYVSHRTFRILGSVLPE